MPAIAAATIALKASHRRKPTRPPVSAAPPTRPRIRARNELTTHTRKNAPISASTPSRPPPRACPTDSKNDHANHAIDAGGDPAGEIALLEARRDVLGDDPVRDRVGDHALQTAADFDAQLAVVFRDEEQRAVVDPLAPELPLVDDANRVLLDRLRARARDDQDRDLASLLRLERRELRFERGALAGVERSGQVRDARSEPGNGDFAPGKRRYEQRGRNCGGAEESICRNQPWAASRFLFRSRP